MQTPDTSPSPVFQTSEPRMVEATASQSPIVEALELEGHATRDDAGLAADDVTPAEALELETREVCVHCGGDAIAGTTCPRSIDCPACKGRAGGPCYSPSGHRRDVLHASRVRTAEWLDEHGTPAALATLERRAADELEAATIAEDGQLGLSVAGDQLPLEGLAPAPIVPSELQEWRA